MTSSSSQYEQIVQNAAKFILEDPEEFRLAMTLVKEAKRQHDIKKEKIKRQDDEFSKFRTLRPPCHQPSPLGRRLSSTTKLVETAINKSYNRDTGDFVREDIYAYIRGTEDDTRYTVGHIAQEHIDCVFDEILNRDHPFCNSISTRLIGGTTVSQVPLLDKNGREIYRVIDQIVHVV